METVRAKKHLGQHFLKDLGIARRIAESLGDTPQNVLEIGPGMGVLTQFLLQNTNYNLRVIEIDTESVEYLHNNFPALEGRIISDDFLKYDLGTLFNDSFSLIGNFPYNISNQILFRVFDNRNNIPLVVGMFQKEVAERIAAKPGSKIYGILSVLLSAFYDIEYLFTVNENVFNPPPKVKSAVIRLRRNSTTALPCDEKLFVSVVKTGFNQRRKTMRNALKPLGMPLDSIPENILQARAEQLSVEDFIALTTILQNLKNQ
ncbi:MAG: 16S rRNA (adenine(1518)-N(6)/adenine(1519)-N(6))-dimethyltransferase RsmA [Bacteroidales bacterium]|nr:16S rRNA (adenine(1518)-N(6)/adenine(1519)-N(6))-dimethyltransferase RsmA [Bacteroidales bacterium]